MRRAVVWSLGWLFAAALYLLLIDITDLPELIAGAAAATIAALAFGLACERDVTGWGGRWRWLARAYRPILKVPSDIVAVSLIALGQLTRRRSVVGAFAAVPFRCGGDDTLETGRRALAESLGSFAPNTIIIGVDPDRELLLGHQLRRVEGVEAIDLLGLG